MPEFVGVVLLRFRLAATGTILAVGLGLSGFQDFGLRDFRVRASCIALELTASFRSRGLNLSQL